jgi:hypothetical protein
MSIAAPLDGYAPGLRGLVDHRGDLKHRVERVIARDYPAGRRNVRSALVSGEDHQVLHHGVKAPLGADIWLSHADHPR